MAPDAVAGVLVGTLGLNASRAGFSAWQVLVGDYALYRAAGCWMLFGQFIAWVLLLECVGWHNESRPTKVFTYLILASFVIDTTFAFKFGSYQAEVPPTCAFFVAIVAWICAVEEGRRARQHTLSLKVCPWPCTTPPEHIAIVRMTAYPCPPSKSGVACR